MNTPTFVKRVNPGVVQGRNQQIAIGFPTDREPFIFKVDSARGPGHEEVRDALYAWLGAHLSAALGEKFGEVSQELEQVVE